MGIDAGALVGGYMSQYYVPLGRPKKIKLTVEKRLGQSPVPLNTRRLLNVQQQQSLRQMETFGWHLAFIRREHLDAPVVVVENANNHCFGRLKEDGSIDTSRQLSIR